VVGAAVVDGVVLDVVLGPVVVVVVDATVLVVVVGAMVVVVVVGATVVVDVVVVVSQYGSLGSHGGGSQSGLLDGIEPSVSHGEHASPGTVVAYEHGGTQFGSSDGIVSSQSHGRHDESYGSHGPLAISASNPLSSAAANAGTITNPATAMRPAIETRLRFICLLLVVPHH
jgi:hypothetical protein